MSTEPETELAPEIAHVLLMDVVGYSRLLVDDQIALLRELNRLVRATPQFLAAEKDGRLMRIPTGDGMALVFFDSPETPVRCAMEIGRQLRTNSDMKLRMGVHSGPIKEVPDVNDRANIAGAGIDTAQRVLDCGDAGHILISKRVADDLIPYRHWHSCLHDLGECEVKHGQRLHIFNLWNESVGNAVVPERVRGQVGHSIREQPGSLRRWRTFIAVCMLAGILAIGGVVWFRSRSAETDPHVPEKSIAVLPFSNLSDDKQNAYFADGVQDQILTNLARIADLKVISRTSVSQFGSRGPRNLREIGRALGVAHVLEGSVQRIADHVRISAQLIDARTDAHLWAESYDRDLSDVFAIQSEVAKSVAAQLQARLSPAEKAAIEERPTNNLEAYARYVQGKAFVAATTFNSHGNEDLLNGARLLEEAVAKDPQFLLAYYQLARAHDQIYRLGVDHTPARLALADAAVKATIRLRPDAGETHLAIGEHLYWGYRDYDRARSEFQIAQRALPNDPRPVLLVAYIDRRQGRSDESLRGFERALELDPRNLTILQQISLSYQHLRRYPEMAAMLDRALAIAPDDAGTRVQRGSVDYESHGELQPLREAIRAIVEKDPTAASNVAESWLNLALCEGDPAEAQRALAVMTHDGCFTEGILYPRGWCIGIAARLQGDSDAAESAFRTARNEIEKTVTEQPNYAEAVSVLGCIDAALGRKEEAIRFGKRAAELLPATQDSIEGALIVQNLALIYAWTGEKDAAIDELSHAAQIPSSLSYGSMKLHPFWNSLRGDPRFEQIMQSLAPK